MFAEPANELGLKLQDRGLLRSADLAYAAAARLDPSWSTPFFNRGLMAKFRHRWPECYRHTLRATELDPDFKPAWWNLGIAATALSDWAVARRAWWRYGVSVPLGDGPPDMKLGSVPIRICPESQGEVVWCHRLDPARAAIYSVPLPESTRAHGDILLTDGEPRGYRSHGGRDVPVFNELDVLVPSAQRTFLAEVVAPAPEDAEALARSATDDSAAIEDWSTIRILCTKCSEGRPHEHEAPTEGAWEANRRFGLAALEERFVVDLLEAWAKSGSGRTIRSLECVFSRA
jgi:hypothetical protein